MQTLIQLLIEPFVRYEFMRLALLTSIIVGSLCSVLSCFLVVKRWALLGDAISHSVLPGVALSYALGLPYFAGALAAGMLSSLGITYIQQNSRIKEDTAMGIVFTGAFALGVALISVVRGQVNLYNILFGNILTVTQADFWLTLITGISVIGVVLFLFPVITFWAFDPTLAQVHGIPVKGLGYLMMLLLTATIVASLRTVGIIMVIAMLITPGATAYLLTYRLPRMMILALVSGNISAVVGLYISYYLNLATGAVMVLVATVLFIITFLFSPSQGVLRGHRGDTGPLTAAGREHSSKGARGQQT